ncbi:chemotaxis protein CheB [Bacillus sp. FJAT-50079]|nr:chemotaxis protein CheB [Bacillus sp. FJAT-50079]
MKINKKIICIGTSTGGPRALQTVLTQLPENLPAPIVIVQHMPPTFTKSLANRLDAICEIAVKEAEDGEELQNGVAYIAPGGKHLKVVEAGLRLVANITEEPTVNGHRPSVDVLFHSASLLDPYDKIAVIMTGMGADGAAGLIEMKQRGETHAIAEAEASCIVFGMPRAAVNTGMVDTIVELDQIASHILKYIG